MYFSQNTAIKRHIYGYPPLYLGATTIQIHQGEGMSTFEMTPNSSILLCSCLTFCHNGIGILLGGKSAYGLALGWRLISKGFPVLESAGRLSITVMH